MIRKFALLIMGACGIWIAALADGGAQPATTDWRGRCTHWYRLSLDPGSRRLVFPFVIDMGIPLQGETIQTSEEAAIIGVFRARGVFTIAIWSDPDSEETSSLEFTTPVGVQIEFVSYDGKTTRSVTEGRLFDLPSPLLPGVVCPNDVKPRPGVASPPRPKVVIKRIEVPTVKRSDEPEEKTIDELKKKYGIGSESSETGKRAKNFNELAEALKRSPEAAPAEPPAGKSTEPVPGKPVPGEPTAGKPAVAPRREAPAVPQSVCRLDTFQPVPMLEEVTDRQMVGWRNGKKEGEAYDYLAAVGDAVGLDALADLTASANKFVSYESVGKIAPRDMPGHRSPSVWVSMKYGGLRWKPDHRRSEPPLPLRVIVAGGAPEIAMSGLDAVGAELRKQSSGRANVTVEWYQPTETGSLGPVQRYDSIEDFVRAADEHKGDGRPIPLGEVEIRSFLDSLQSILIEQTQPFDRVFWIKGGYMVPSAIPARFEEFIESVVRKSAPVRGLGSWLTVVTANMPGFSIGYLQAPVYSKSVGDVIVQPQYSGTTQPRYITDPKVLAARLWASASTRAAAASAADSGPAASGKLVFDAKDVFVQRGYVLTLDTLDTLRTHLGTIEATWNGGSPFPAALADLAKKTGRPSATLIDLLQNAGGTPLLPLPKRLPDWVRKPLDKLDEGERSEAADLIKRYRDGVGAVEDKWQRQRETRDPGCGFAYVPEQQFGLK